MLFQLNGAKASLNVTASAFPPRPPMIKSENDKKRQYDPQRRDGRYTSNQHKRSSLAMSGHARQMGAAMKDVHVAWLTSASLIDR